MSLVSFTEADISNLVFRMEQVGARARKHMIEKMRDYAFKVQYQAIRYAPVKSGALHSAIKVEERGGGQGVGGRFQRKELRIFVDGSVPGGEGKWSLAEYAYMMHEGLGPFGDYTYGAQGLNVPWRRQSKAHDGGTGVVGGKFLTRAIEEVADEYALQIAEAARRAFR